MSEPKHLWEISHPYYGPEQCYYANGAQARGDSSEFESWAEFATPSDGKNMFTDEWNLLYDFDDDLNFLYRWDWKRADSEDYYLKPGDPDDESEAFAEAQKFDRLCLFFMLQRKGRMVYAEVKVTEDDEPTVREWLEKKASYMRSMWEPVLGVDSEHDRQVAERAWDECEDSASVDETAHRLYIYHDANPYRAAKGEQK